jgi:hypothetical protein
MGKVPGERQELSGLSEIAIRELIGFLGRFSRGVAMHFNRRL